MFNIKTLKSIEHHFKTENNNSIQFKEGHQWKQFLSFFKYFFAVFEKIIYFCGSIFNLMGVTRLKRKEAKIRSRMNKRVQTIKRLRGVLNVASPYKGESGIILEDQE